MEPMGGDSFYPVVPASEHHHLRVDQSIGRAATEFASPISSIVLRTDELFGHVLAKDWDEADPSDTVCVYLLTGNGMIHSPKSVWRRIARMPEEPAAADRELAEARSAPGAVVG